MSAPQGAYTATAPTQQTMNNAFFDLARYQNCVHFWLSNSTEKRSEYRTKATMLELPTIPVKAICSCRSTWGQNFGSHALQIQVTHHAASPFSNQKVDSFVQSGLSGRYEGVILKPLVQPRLRHFSRISDPTLSQSGIGECVGRTAFPDNIHFVNPIAANTG
jgi:hypothetical protein